MTVNLGTSDTSADADAFQLDLLRRMTPKQRMAKVFGLSANLRRMAFDAIYRRHPDYTEDQARLAFIEVTYGKSLADDVRRWQQERSF